MSDRLWRLHDCFTLLIFVVYGFLALRLLNYATMSLALPMADDFLSGIDHMAGLDWHAYAQTVVAVPGLVPVLRFVYHNLILVGFAILLVLYLTGRDRQAHIYVELSFWNGLLITLIGMAFPAYGSVSHYASSAIVHALGPGSGTYHISALEHLREGSDFVFGATPIPGLVEFPSFHTAAGILMVYAFRGNRLLLALALIYTIGMISSTPLIGGHYFIDLMAGAFVAIASCLWAFYFKEDRGRAR